MDTDTHGCLQGYADFSTRDEWKYAARLLSTDLYAKSGISRQKKLLIGGKKERKKDRKNKNTLT